MKAAVCRAFGEPLVIEEIGLAEPGHGEVHVDLAACAICHSDIIYMDGGWGGDLPAIFGHEAAGIVQKTGEGVENIKKGDHVLVTLIRSCGRCPSCAQGQQVLCDTVFPLDENSPIRGSEGENICQGLRTGAFAEAVVVDQSQIAKIPKTLPFDSASLLSCGVITGLGAVTNTASVRPGQSVVVIGTGGVGLNCVQGARLVGADPIIAIDPAEIKLETARAFGATHGFTPEAAQHEVMALTGGRGADHVLVSVGSGTAIEKARALLGKGGTLTIVGMPPTGTLVSYDPCDVASGQQRIIGSKMGSTRLAVDIPNLVALYEQGRLKLDELVSGRYPLSGINDAIASSRSGSALRNVVLF